MSPTAPALAQPQPEALPGPPSEPGRCPACGGALGSCESSRYRRCTACRVRVSLVPEGSYGRDYYYHGASFDQRLAARAREQVAHLKRLEAGLGLGLRPRGAASRLLELGCGKGFFVEAALAAGFDARGLDLSAAAIAAGRRRGLGQRLMCADARELDPQTVGGGFDLVVAWELLEHVEQPVEFLRSAARLLRPGGWLLGSTPNGDSPWIGALGSGWHGFDIPEFHRLYLTAEGFAHVARRAGLDRPSCLSINERSGLFLLKNTATALARRLWSGPDKLRRGLLAAGLALPHWMLERAAGRVPGLPGETLLFAAQLGQSPADR